MVSCRLMSYDSRKIPLLRHAQRDEMLIGMSDSRTRHGRLTNDSLTLDDNPQLLGHPFLPPSRKSRLL